MAKVSLSVPESVVSVLGGGDRGRAAATIKEFALKVATAYGFLLGRRDGITRILQLLFDQVDRILDDGKAGIGELRALLAIANSLLELIKDSDVTSAERAMLEAFEKDISIALDDLSRAEKFIEKLAEMGLTKDLRDSFKEPILTYAAKMVLGVVYRLVKFTVGKLADLQAGEEFLERLSSYLKRLEDQLLSPSTPNGISTFYT